MAVRQFRDRRDAGRLLASRLERYRDRDAVVLALPRGGVPVGYEVARALGLPLDVFVVRKLGVPGREELAMGAIAGSGQVVANEDVVRALKLGPEVLRRVAEIELRELRRREQEYRGGRPPPRLAGRIALVVDDGLATGSSMRAAVLALRASQPARIVIAVPVAPEPTCRELAAHADEVVCYSTPRSFLAVGQAYEDFTQVTDGEVRQLLEQAGPATAGRPPDGPAPAGDAGFDAHLP